MRARADRGAPAAERMARGEAPEGFSLGQPEDWRPWPRYWSAAPPSSKTWRRTTRCGKGFDRQNRGLIPQARTHHYASHAGQALGTHPRGGLCADDVGGGFRRSHLSKAIAAWKTAKAQVRVHLGKTGFVICCQLLGDITEQGFEANDALFEFFVQKYGGMIQADGEGFYGAEGLLVDLS